MRLRLPTLNLIERIRKGLHLLSEAFLLKYAVLNLLLLLEIQGGVPYIQESFDIPKIEVRRVLAFVELG